MDWSNERYVRLYVRDTTTWHRLGWDGQAVLSQVLRKLDMAGVLDIDDMEPWEAVVMHCRAPEQAARAGMSALLRLGVLVHVGSAIVMPHYVDAQTATKSDRQRQREARDRRKAEACHDPSQLVTTDDVPGAGVTESSRNVTDGEGMSRNVTHPSGSVTDASQSVTAGHDSSLYAVLGCAVQDYAVQDRHTDARACATPPIRQRLAGAWDGIGGAGTSPTMLHKLDAAAPRIAELAGTADPVEWFRGVVARFRADPQTQAKRLGLPILLANLDAWATDAPRSTEPTPPSHVPVEVPADWVGRS